MWYSILVGAVSVTCAAQSSAQLRVISLGNALATTKPRKRRSEAAIWSGGHDPFEFLCFKFGEAISQKNDAAAIELGLALLPYCRPKLRQVEANVNGNVNVRIRIGGDAHPLPTDGDDYEDAEPSEEGGVE